MVTPQSTAAVSAENTPTRMSSRALVIWLLFAGTLVTGLVLAVRFGGSAPVLLDEVLR